MAERNVPTRQDYKVFYPVTTRWVDNDIYGHVNNAVYYTYFDSGVNQYLIAEGGLDIHNGDIVGFVVSSSCDYVSPIAYPDELEVAVRTDKVGNSSVQYGVAVFRKGAAEASAHGKFVHVFVEKATNQSVTIPDRLRQALVNISA